MTSLYRKPFYQSKSSIMRQLSLCFFCILHFSFLLTGQSDSIKIHGTLYDDTGAELMFANIISFPSGIGVETEIDGGFHLTVPKTDQYLEAQYVGYSSQRISIDSTKSELKLDIHLSTRVILEEVVVVGMSVKKEKKSTGYSVAIVSGKSMGISSRLRNKKVKPQKPEIANSESYSEIIENTFINTLDEALSTFSVDVDRASYSNMRRFINFGEAPPKDAIRIEELINYFDYGYQPPKDHHPVVLQTALSSCPWNTDQQLLHIALKGKELQKEQLPPSNLVFLIDVSGSMNAPNKLPLVKESLLLLLDNLNDHDRVSLVTYAGRSGVALNSTSLKNKDKIVQAINALGAGGSTAGSEGIKTAYNIAQMNFIEKGNNRIILATDGDFNVGLSSNEDLKKLIEEKRKSEIFLSILAYGTGNYQDDLMQTLATHGNGSHYYIDDISEAHKVFDEEFSGTLFPVAKDVKIQIEFNPIHVKSYRLIGYVNRLLDKKDFNNDKVDASEIGSGHEVTAIYEIIPATNKKEIPREVDDLKYQKQITKNSNKPFMENEIANLKFRYKNVKEDKSQKIEDIILNEEIAFTELTENQQFAICVAAFGMKLTDSKHVSKFKTQDIIHFASNAKGADENGQKQEFIDLMKKYKKIKKRS